MLTIICGEDVIASRDYFHKLKEEYRSGDAEIVTMQKVDIDAINPLMTESSSLFSQKRILFTENLVKVLKKQKSKSTLEKVDELAHSKSFDWYDWEELTAREIANPKKVKIKEFKLSLSIFKLLDSCYPGNLKNFLSGLSTLADTQEEGFIYSMLCRHIRSLIVVKSGAISSITPWQKKMLSSQASLWPTKKLVSFYEGLGRIDISAKTSSSPYSLKQSLDILACYIL